jgi:hypothetical protein
MGKNLVWAWVEDFHVGVHTATTPSAEEWDAMVADLKTRKMSGSLIYTLGGSPSAKQRKQLRDTIGERAIYTAVLTDSAIARAAIVALNLFMRNPVHPFPPDELEQALQYTKAPPRLWTELKKALHSLKLQLNIV